MALISGCKLCFVYRHTAEDNAATTGSDTPQCLVLYLLLSPLKSVSIVHDWHSLNFTICMPHNSYFLITIFILSFCLIHNTYSYESNLKVYETCIDSQDFKA